VWKRIEVPRSVSQKQSGAARAFRSDRAVNSQFFDQSLFVMQILPAVAVSAAATAFSTATTTAAATPAISAASTTTAATRAAGAGASLVNLDSPSLQVGVVESLDCSGRIGRLRHLDEPEAARLAREFIRDHYRAFDFPSLSKELRQVILRNRVGEIAYIQLSGHKSPPYFVPGSSYTDDPAGCPGSERKAASKAC
jgi:hypothetical protein